MLYSCHNRSATCIMKSLTNNIFNKLAMIDADSVPLVVLVYSELALHTGDFDTMDEDFRDKRRILTTGSLLADLQSDHPAENNSDIESEIEAPLPRSDMTHAEVLIIATKIKNFALKNYSTYLGIAQELNMMTERNIVNKHCQQKQTTLLYTVCTVLFHEGYCCVERIWKK